MSLSSIEPAASPDDVLLSLTDLSAIVGLGHTATKCLVRRPGFPNQVRLSQRVVRWWRSEVMAWLHEQHLPARRSRPPQRNHALPIDPSGPPTTPLGALMARNAPVAVNDAFDRPLLLHPPMLSAAYDREFNNSGMDRFEVKVHQTPYCHWWLAGTDTSGYGIISVNGRKVGAHRRAWERANGPIAAGLCVHHVCHNRRCVNPKHLELVTRAENGRVQMKRRVAPACRKGHNFTAKNTIRSKDGGRRCRTCSRASNARWMRQYRAKMRGASSSRQSR